MQVARETMASYLRLINTICKKGTVPKSSFGGIRWATVSFRASSLSLYLLPDLATDHWNRTLFHL